jgi:hypothetical protein
MVDSEERSFRGTPQNSFHKAVNMPDVVVFWRYLLFKILTLLVLF